MNPQFSHQIPNYQQKQGKRYNSNYIEEQRISSLFGFVSKPEMPPDLSIQFRANPPLPLNEDIGKPKCRQYGGLLESLEVFNKLISKETDAINTISDTSKIVKIAKKIKQNNEELKEKIKDWNPKNDSNITGEPEKVIFIGRLAYDVDERILERNFRLYGKIENIRIVKDNKGKSRGYAFIEYKYKEDAKEAYKKADNMPINGRRIIVDYEKCRIKPGFLPNRLGGKGGYRRRNPDWLEKALENIYEKNPELKPEKLSAYRKELLEKKLSQAVSNYYSEKEKEKQDRESNFLNSKRHLEYDSNSKILPSQEKNININTMEEDDLKRDNFAFDSTNKKEDEFKLKKNNSLIKEDGEIEEN